MALCLFCDPKSQRLGSPGGLQAAAALKTAHEADCLSYLTPDEPTLRTSSG